MKDPTSVPSWMTEPQPYTPPSDHDGFVTKSILTLMGVLARVGRSGNPGPQRTQAPVKLLFTLLVLVLLACSQNFFFVGCVLALVLVRLCFLPAKALGQVVRGAMGAALFSALLLLPSALLGSPHTLVNVSSKVLLSVALVEILAVSTPWNRLTEGLRLVWVPDLFLLTLDLTLKYIVLLGQVCLDMLQALRLRSVGRNRQKGASLAGVLGVTFLKSQGMAQEQYDAMRCRGFQGSYRRPRHFRPNLWDGLTGLLGVGLTALFLYLERGV